MVKAQLGVVQHQAGPGRRYLLELELLLGSQILKLSVHPRMVGVHKMRLSILLYNSILGTTIYY